MKDTFVVITFPDVQLLMDCQGFKNNCCLVNDEPFLSEYGSSAYFVRQSWLNLIQSDKPIVIWGEPLKDDFSDCKLPQLPDDCDATESDIY